MKELNKNIKVLKEKLKGNNLNEDSELITIQEINKLLLKKIKINKSLSPLVSDKVKIKIK